MKRWVAGVALLGAAVPLSAQSAMERSPNVQGVWTLPAGEAVFVFAHRFELMDGGDEMFNVPTLTLGVGAPLGFTLGLDFSSNSEVVSDRLAGNETQYWLKHAVPLPGALDGAATLARNTVAGSWDAAADVRLSHGPAALFAEARGFTDRFGDGDPGFAGAVGARLKLTEYLAVTGDVGRVLDADSFPSVWSAGLAVIIPGSPHTLSLHATNGGVLTFQGASREKVLGTPDRVRYGFSFSVPLGGASRWGRIFAPAAPPPPPPATSDTARAEIRLVAFQPAEIRVRAGQVVQWVNRDPLEHTVTADGGDWGSEPIGEGEVYARRFDEPGRYPFHCTPHPQMKGVVIVEESR